MYLVFSCPEEKFIDRSPMYLLIHSSRELLSLPLLGGKRGGEIGGKVGRVGRKRGRKRDEKGRKKEGILDASESPNNFSKLNGVKHPINNIGVQESVEKSSFTTHFSPGSSCRDL